MPVEPNYPPEIYDTSGNIVTTENAGPISGYVNAWDPNGDYLHYTVGIVPTLGALALKWDGTYIYTPNPGQSGEDQFSVVVDDYRGGISELYVSVSIAEVLDDYLWGTSGDDTIHGEDGDDHLYGRDGADTLYGDAGDDAVHGQAGNDVLYGGTGNDRLYGEDGDDILYGGEDDDVLQGGIGDDTLYGDLGNDVLQGGAGDDTLFGGDGDDLLQGQAGTNVLYGGDGNDVLQGGADDDTLYGGTGDDDLWGGGSGNDYFHGGDGNDKIQAGSGNDTLIGGSGDDIFYGGAGTDTFILDEASVNGTDRFWDFTSGEDVIAVRAADYGLPAGALDPSRFNYGSAGDAAPSFVYDSQFYTLYWDADGIGGAAPTKLATFSVFNGSVNLTAQDIFVI